MWAGGAAKRESSGRPQVVNHPHVTPCKRRPTRRAEIPVSDTAIRKGRHMPRQPQGGRPSKGDRDLLVTRPSRAVGDAVRARADAAGLTISDYVAALLATVHDLPEHAPRPLAGVNQEELPLSRSA